MARVCGVIFTVAGALLAGCGSATPTAGEPPRVAVVDRCAEGRTQLKRAKESLEQGKLDRARRILELDVCEKLSGERAGLRESVGQAIGNVDSIEPFAAFVEARKTQNASDARRHWDRGALALEAQAKSRGRLVAALSFSPPSGRLSQISIFPPSHDDKTVLLWPDELDGAWVPRRIGTGLKAPWVDVPLATATVAYENVTYLLRPGGVEDIEISPAKSFEAHILPGGRWVLACSNPARLIDPTTGAVTAQADSGCGRIEMVAVDRLVTTFPLEIWELPTLKKIAAPPVTHHTETLFFDHAMRRMAYVDGNSSADDVVVTVVELENGSVVWTKALPQPAPFLIDLSDDGSKLAVVGEKTTVVDVDKKTVRELGGKAHFPYRPGHYRHGWGDHHTPPVSTDAVGAFDDGRVCVVQGDTPALLPSVADQDNHHHCDIHAGDVVEMSVKADAGFQWQRPPPDGEDGRRTLRIDAATRRVARIEVKGDTESIALYDGSTGALERRIPASSIQAVAKDHFDRGFWLERFDGPRLMIGIGWPSDYVAASISVADGTLVADPTAPQLSNVSAVAVSPALKTPVGNGFAIEYPGGYLELVDADIGPGWHCQYRDILTPFEACAERLLVRGHYADALRGATSYALP